MSEGRQASRRASPGPESILRGRFRIERTLGEGGFGSVFEAYDLLRGVSVALKTVHSTEHLLRLKREFRSLAELEHRNLIELFELHGEGSEWFFTMELVKGPSLREHLEMVAPHRSGVVTLTQTISQQSQTPPTPLGSRRAWSEAIIDSSGERSPANVEKLRSALAQIASGLSYLHAAGKLHLDVKPSNVLVSEDARVVLADFGLARDRTDPTEPPPSPDEIVLFGTPLYMAPEQAIGAPLSPAADAYSLGVLLYEALTGQVPFNGTTSIVLAAKQLRPIAVRSLHADAPEDLATLCDALLAPQPEERATIERVLEVVGERSAYEVQPERLELVGREREHGALRAMLAQIAAHPQPLLAVIDAPSGGGKSALVRAFCEAVRSEKTTVLTARCRVDEWVEFEAVDAIVDQLSALSGAVAPELGLLFATVASSHEPVVVADRAEARRLGFRAFRSALRRVSERAPVVLWIDDAQWGSVDSGAILAEALRGPEAPAVLLVCTMRTGASAPMIERIVQESGVEQRTITLSPLDDQSASALIDQCASEISAEQRQAIVASAKGNPFFLTELAARTTPGSATDVDADVRARIERLSDSARRVLAAVSLAGRPMARGAIAQIAMIDGERELRAINELRAGRFVTVFRRDGVEQLDVWHDRVRDNALATMPTGAARVLHWQIAQFLIAQRESDALAIAHHLDCSDHRAEAARWAIRAANRAAEHGAFDAAARAFERALALEEPVGEARSALLATIAEHWALAGRAELAANAFELAALDAAPSKALALRERAASLLLGAGHIERGLTMMRAVLGAVGERLPRSRVEVLARLGVARAKLLARGLRFDRRNEGRSAPRELVRIDALHSVAAGLSLVDTVAGAYFSSVHLLEALRAGEPRRIAIALSTEQCFLAGRGGLFAERDERAVGELLARLADELDEPDIHARVHFARGTAAFLRASFDTAIAELTAALAHWKAVANVEHERSTCEHFILAARTWIGQHAIVEAQLPEVLQRARDAGDLYAETTIETAIGHIPWLVRAQPDRARALLDRSIARWSSDGFFVQHYDELVASVDVDLYRDHGCGERALVRLQRGWSGIERSLLRNVQVIRVESDYARGRAIIAALCGATPPNRPSLMRELSSIHRAMLRGETPWAIGLAHCVGAALAMEAGERRRAISALDRATGALAVANIQGYRAAALLYRATLTNERARAEQARDELRAQGVREPDRFALAFVPGRR
ncbi:MAG: protein kinase [Polyangiales bacterium]